MPTIDTAKISPCLWFAGDAEEAARFYVSLLPDTRIERVMRAPGDYPAGKTGDALLVEFTLAGQVFTALNGGQGVQPSQAVSLMIACDDQAEIDRLWDAFLAGGGREMQCGWIVDRWGFAWQVAPRVFQRLFSSDDAAANARAFTAMMGMVKLDIATLVAAHEGRLPAA